MEWRKRSGDSQAADAGPFQWDHERVAAFLNAFHEHQGMRRCDLAIELTHQFVDSNSWNLSTETLLGDRTDDRYLGWWRLNTMWRGGFGVQLPAQLVLIHHAEYEYKERSGSDWSGLEPLGQAYLWKRGRDTSKDIHGLEATLHLDSRRYQHLHQAVLSHKGALPPVITLGMRMRSSAQPVDAAPQDQSAVAAHEPFDIMAYWTHTCTFTAGSSPVHPWVE